MNQSNQALFRLKAARQTRNLRFHMLQPGHLQPFLSHLDAEEAALRAFYKVMEELPSMMVSREQERLFRQRLEQAMAVAEQMSERRRAVLVYTGQLCGLEEDDLSISGLMGRCEPSAVAVLVHCRTRLQRVVSKIQHMSTIVGWIMNESRILNTQVLQELTGDMSSSRYTATGVHSVAPDSTQFHTRS